MLYRIVRPYAAIGLRVYYRKINLAHAERIPWDKPVIIAANHPTAFIEPCILACFLPKPLYFLVAGIYFSKPLFNTLLRALNMLPVYRANELGFSSVRQNYETFEACYDALRERKPIMILAEGHTSRARRLNPLKKATARVAFGAVAKYPELRDLQIVPIGVNYTDANRFRSEVMIEVQHPVPIADFLAGYAENPSAAIQAFNETLWRELARGVIHIERPEDEPLAEELLTFATAEAHQTSPPVLSADARPLQHIKKVTERVNPLAESEKTSLRRQVDAYTGHLEKQGLTDRTLVLGPRYRWWHTLFILAGAPLFLLGWLLNAGPLLLARKIARDKVRRSEFYAPVLWAAGLGAYLVYGLLLLVVVPALFGVAGLAALLFLPFLGLLALWYYDFFQTWRQDRRLRHIPEPERIALLREREALFS